MSTTIRHILDHINHDELVGEPGGTPVGPWQNFIPDPGWGVGTLRYRTVPGGLQFDGAQLGSIGQGALARVGVLSPGYIPARQQVMMCAVIAGVTYGWGFVIFQINGDVIAMWGVSGGTQMVVAGIVALD